MPFAVNVAASEASESVRPYLPLAERVGRLFTGLAGGAPSTLNIEYEGEIADYDCRVLTLSILKGVLAPVVAEPVSFVNAPQIAEQRGISVRETKSSDALDYVNLIVVRGDQGTHVAATLFGKHQAPRIVGIDGHQVDLPPAQSHARRAQRRQPGHDRSRRVGARRRGPQHLEHGRRSEPERRGRADGDRDRHAGARRGRRAR